MPEMVNRERKKEATKLRWSTQPRLSVPHRHHGNESKIEERASTSKDGSS